MFCVCFRTDGYVVCEEHEEIIRAAWVEEQELQRQREKEVWVHLCMCACVCVTNEVEVNDLSSLRSRKEKKGRPLTGLCW